MIGEDGCRQCRMFLWGCGPGYRLGFGLLYGDWEGWGGVWAYSYRLL